MLYLAVSSNVGKFSNYINDSTFLNGIDSGCVYRAESCRIAAQCIRCLIILIIFAVLKMPCLSALLRHAGLQAEIIGPGANQASFAMQAKAIINKV